MSVFLSDPDDVLNGRDDDTAEIRDWERHPHTCPKHRYRRLYFNKYGHPLGDVLHFMDGHRVGHNRLKTALAILLEDLAALEERIQEHDALVANLTTQMGLVTERFVAGQDRIEELTAALQATNAPEKVAERLRRLNEREAELAERERNVAARVLQQMAEAMGIEVEVKK